MLPQVDLMGFVDEVCEHERPVGFTDRVGDALAKIC